MKAKHLSVLDGLRGFAALVVIVSHCAAFGFLPKFLGGGLGQMGVMLFFGLSGFLMAYLYCGKELNLASLREYVVHRTARVLPLYYIVASFTALCFIGFGYSFLKVFSWKDIAGNLLLLRGSSILWTIPVEVHFYIMFIALWFAANRGKFLVLIISLWVVQSSSLFGLYLVGVKHGPILYSWLHLFIFGSFVGFYYNRIDNCLQRSKFSAHLSAFAWSVLLSGVIAPPQLRKDFGFPTMVNFLDPVTVGYPMLLLICAVFSLGPFSLFKHPVLCWYGKISFSLYLLHAFVIDGVTEMANRGAIATELGFPVVLALATLLATASFYGIERPAQRMLRSYFSGNQKRAGLPASSMSLRHAARSASPPDRS